MSHTPEVNNDVVLWAPNTPGLNGIQHWTAGYPDGVWQAIHNTPRRRAERQRPESVHATRNRGWRDPMNYYHRGRSYTKPQCHWRALSVGGWYPGYGWEYAPFFTSNTHAFDTELRIPYTDPSLYMQNMCLLGARSKLKSNGAQLGLAFLERKKTAAMLGTKAEQILATALDVLRKGPRKAVAEVLSTQGQLIRRKGESLAGYRGRWLSNLATRGSKRFANEWLEVQYGWVPTLLDMHSALSATADAEFTYDGREVRVKHVLKDETVVTRTFDSGGPIWDTSYLLQEGVFVRLDYFVDCPLARTAADIGLLNPLSIAWELVPFSFVTDWAVPIGPWLDSLDATSGLSFKGGSISTVVRASGKVRFVDLPGWLNSSGTGVTLFSKEDGQKFGMFNMKRTVYSSSPVPFPPTFDFKVGSGRFKNGMALLAQQLSKFAGKRR